MSNVMDLFTLDTYPSSLHLESHNLNETNETIKSKKLFEWIPYYIQDCVFKEGSSYIDLISEALKKSDNKISSKKLRLLLFNYYSSNELSEFKQTRNIKTKKQLKKYIDTFDGDNNTLTILSDLLNIDFYIFDKKSQLPIEISTKSNNIILLDTNPGIIGFYLDKKTPQTFFNRQHLPFILESLTDKNMYFINKITEFYKSVETKNFTLIKLYNYLESNLNKKINVNDKKIILDIIKDLIKTIKLNSHKIKLKSIKKSLLKHNSIKKSSLKHKSIKKLIKKMSLKKSIRKIMYKSLKKMSLKKSKNNKKRKEKSKIRVLKKRALRPIKK